MIDFLILTDPQGEKRLIAIDKIVHIDYATGGGSRLFLAENQTIQAKESVDSIIENIHSFYNH